MNNQGMLIIGSGPSGAGKNSVFSEVIKLQQGRVQEQVTCTTRDMRPGEVEGVDYYFVTLDKFNQMEHDGEFLEAAGAHNGRRYGTPLQPVLDKLAQGIDVLLIIEVNGAKQAREKMPDALTIFIMPAGDTLEEKANQLQDQLHGRGHDKHEHIQERLELARTEIEQAKDYQYVVVNAPGELEAAIQEVNGIINRARAERQTAV